MRSSNEDGETVGSLSYATHHPNPTVIFIGISSQQEQGCSAITLEGEDGKMNTMLIKKLIEQAVPIAVSLTLVIIDVVTETTRRKTS